MISYEDTGCESGVTDPGGPTGTPQTGANADPDGHAPEGRHADWLDLFFDLLGIALRHRLAAAAVPTR
ncbi:hypothetical protein [Streptomyces sp. NPDC057686]|uniref:hypothetical protein n=1 Tax=Streptomyces sp. NPDC057686 TaxID=3346212 RepID=UPI0036CB23F9